MQQSEGSTAATDQNNNRNNIKEDGQKDKDKVNVGNKSPHYPVIRQRCLFTANPAPKVIRQR